MMATFKEHLHLPVTMIDDSERMLSELKVQRSATRHATSLDAALRPCWVSLTDKAAQHSAQGIISGMWWAWWDCSPYQLDCMPVFG